MTNNNFRLKNIYLREINSKKIDQKDIEKEKQSDSIYQPIAISGQIMYNKNDKDLIKYLFGFELNLKNEFEISIIYETYFKLVDEKMNALSIEENEINEDELGNLFNEQIWPYVIEQVNSITSKMNLKRGITLPPYGVIVNE